MNQFFREDEQKSRDMELQQLTQILTHQKIDFQERYDKSTRYHSGKLTEKEQEDIEREDQITKEKITQAEKSKIYVNFFNKYALKLISKTPSVILSELAIRVFTGSRDVPKDNIKAVKLFEFSDENAQTEKEKHQVEYYKLLLRKYKIHQETVLAGQVMNKDQEAEMIDINAKLNALARSGNSEAQYTYGKELLSLLRQDSLNDKKAEREFFQQTYDYLTQAAKKGVNSAYFYLGLMYMDGLYVKKDQEKAVDCYIKGAAKNNAYCFFELSRVYSEGVIVERDPKLQFHYLKRSAEEGFVTAQHLLGIAYHEGKFTKRNDSLALAWFRESIRNGNIVSYLNAGDLLYEGGVNLKQNRLFAFLNYMGAYQNGAIFLRDKLEKLILELRDIEGEKIPDITFMEVPREMEEMYNMSKQQENQKQASQI
eukprot:403331695